MAFIDRFARRSGREWLSSLPVLLLLLVTIGSETLEFSHAQLLKLGEHWWKDYYLLRTDIPTPTCKLNVDMEAEIERLEKAYIAEAEADPLGLFEPEPFDESAARKSIEGRIDVCRKEFSRAEENQARVTDTVRTFRTIEGGMAVLTLTISEKQRFILLLMLFICALTSSATRHHIAFRPVTSLMDHRISAIAQLVGNLILAYSSWTHYQSAIASGIAVEHPETLQLLIVGFVLLSAVSLYQLVTTPMDLIENGARVESGECERGGGNGNVVHALLTIPLYTYMAFIAGNYFFFTEGHGGGVAIYVSQLLEQAKMFIKVGLYIWIGMLLKQTRLGELVFNVFKPWKMPPELLAVIAILVMAVPTAYTGASGIIIIAMGVVVYNELRRAGARRQLALATTAMTGSAGVVLRPCLLVVLIAALNKEVVTDQLYGWGSKVFLLSALLFLLAVLVTRKEKLTMASYKYALAPSLRALIPLAPYVLIFIIVGGVYALLLDAYLDEFSAPTILPIIVIAVLFYEKFIDKTPADDESEDKPPGFEGAIRIATTEATVHIGALIMLMGLSFATGGVIERSGFFEDLPETFSTIWVAMSLMLIMLIGIGMVMDPFGAAVLVTGTIAAIAYANGIHPVHFWMVTLVAFELGYLSPPVALNHLLTRQVVGEREAALAAHEGENFWYRHEKILLPLIVMGITLLLVAYVPLMFY